MELIPSLPDQRPPLLYPGREPLVTPKAPALIRLRPKSVYSDVDEAKTIERGCLAQVGAEFPLPILYGREMVGWAMGKRGSKDVLYLPDRKPIEKGAEPMLASGINTYDDIIQACAAGRRLPMVWSKGATTAGVANNWYDAWGITGNPGSGVYTGTAFTAKAFDNTFVGSLPIGANVSPLIRCLTNLWGVATAGATQPILVLYDRVVTYELCIFNNNANKALTNGATPPGARYSSGTQRGLQCWVGCQLVFNATAQSFTLFTYANQAQTTGQVMNCATTLTNITVSAAAQTANLGARIVSPNLTAAGTTTAGPYMPLAAGDTGVTWLQNYTTSAATINTGSMVFVLGAPLFVLPLSVLNVVSMMDAVNMVSNLERVFDAACLSFLIYFPVATGATITGGVEVVWN